jgi:hypothetical protein
MCNTCGCKDAESFDAEGPRILNIKNVKYVGDSMDIKIELEQGGKKYMYQGVLNKGSGCDKCGSKVMGQWERKGQIMDLCKECYLMHFYDAESFEAPNELIEIDGYNPLRAEKYMDMVLFYVGDRADLRYSHDSRGRPTTERQLLGNSPHYKSVINPLGIRMADIDIVMNSGLPEIIQKEWDGKYILFDEGGTFTTGKPVNYFDSSIEYKYAEGFDAEWVVEAVEQNINDRDFVNHAYKVLINGEAKTYEEKSMAIVETMNQNANNEDFTSFVEEELFNAEGFDADLDVWSPEKEVIEQIKRSERLLEEFPMISYDSRWNPDKVNEWSPERQVIEEIRGSPMYEDEFPYLGRHPGYYNDDGYWVERYNPELYGIEPEIEIPWWIQLGIGIGSVTGLTYLLKKMSK